MSQENTGGKIAWFTAQRIAQLQDQKGERFFRGILAQLRRGVGQAPGEMPQLWGFFLDGLPEEWMGNREPSRAEWAIYTVLTLFALHQQGQERSMNQPGISLGAAVRKLADLDRDKKNKDAEPDERGVSAGSARCSRQTARKRFPITCGGSFSCCAGKPCRWIIPCWPGICIGCKLQTPPRACACVGDRSIIPMPHRKKNLLKNNFSR